MMADTGNVMEALQALSNKDLGRLLRELTIYAEIRLSKLGFVPKTEVDSVSGEDFAQEAFKLTIEGKRTWPIKEHPDFAEFLRMVVFSLIRNHFKKSGRAPVNIRDLNATQVDDSDNVSTEFVDFASPDEVLITVEQWQRIEMAFGDDLDGFIFFTDWLDDLPPREIAEKYSEEVTVIYRKIKKGKGIITKIFSS